MDGANAKAAELLDRCNAHLDRFGEAADPLKGAAEIRIAARKKLTPLCNTKFFWCLAA